MSQPAAKAPMNTHERFFNARLPACDPEIYAAMKNELRRQQDQIELIASENIVSQAVIDAVGSILTNKYAEGYPGRRYYGGCEFVDVAETLAIERAKKLFNCAFVNVQAHSGSQANQSVMLALLKPGDTIMGMSLACGGHLTHGAAPNLSGKWFNAVQYGVRRDDPTGAAFDPNLHQAMAEQESAEHPPGTVLQAWTPAWTLNGRLLRPAMVVVARNTPKNENTSCQTDSKVQEEK